jgi:hypothetical protein
LWTVAAVGFGIFLASAQIDGQTPMEHAQRAWKRKVNPSKVDQLKNGLRDAIDSVSDKKPTERYLEDEREAIERLVAGASKGR